MHGVIGLELWSEVANYERGVGNELVLKSGAPGWATLCVVGPRETALGTHTHRRVGRRIQIEWAEVFWCTELQLSLARAGDGAHEATTVPMPRLTMANGIDSFPDKGVSRKGLLSCSGREIKR